MKKKGFFLIIILVGAFSYFLYSTNQKEVPKEEKKVEEKTIFDEVKEKLINQQIKEDFLKWIDKNYPNSFKKLNKILEKEPYQESLWHEATGDSYIVLKDKYEKKYEEMNNIKILDSKEMSTLSFVGDISLADNWYIMPKYDEREKKVYGILAEDVVKEMTESDLMVANSEFTVSNRGSAMRGKLYTFRAKPERLAIYYEMGIDMVTLANNHVYDFGEEAFLDMLEAMDEYKIPRIGAGKNIEEAMKPYYFIINGYKFSFVNATRAEKYILTPGATETTPGVFRCYDPTNMANLIQKEKETSDYVIAIIHFGKEGYHELEAEQVSSAKLYIDSGADAVIGHHAHTLQGIEFYKEKPIVYNLGDFIFNANKEETAIFQIKLKNNGSMEYYILPALQENCFTRFLEGEEKQKLIQNIISWGINADISSDGKITERKAVN